MKKLFVVSIFVAATGVTACGGWRTSRDGAQTRPAPDVVLITMDTTRADRLGAYGSAAGATPRLDNLARAGVTFRRAYSHAPTTLASHASLLTGLTPASHGVHENGVFVLGPEHPTLAEAFARAGYRTGAFVSAVVLDRRYGLARGFDVYEDAVEDDDSETVMAQVTADVTVDRAREFIDARDMRPMFLWVHLYDPHAPYAPPEPFASRFADRRYEGEIAFMDEHIGRLLDHVATRQRPALIAATADHGESLGEHQEPTHAFFVYSGTQRVPLVLSYPGVLPAGTTVDPLVRAVDVAPTLLELAGLPALEKPVDGLTVRPLIEGGVESEPRSAYLESYGPRLWWGARELLGLRFERWLYVRTPQVELYDVDADPGETRNVAARQPDVVARIDRALSRVIADGDPLAKQVAVDAAAARRLRALGYLGGNGASGTTPRASGSPAMDAPPLVDAKTVAPLLGDIASAEAFLDSRDYPAALKAFRALATRVPHAASMRAREAKILLAMDRFDEAFAAFSALSREWPDDEGYALGMVRSRLRAKRNAEALAVARAALVRFPESPVLHENVGLCLEALARADEAESSFRRAAELGPSETGPRLALAVNLDKRQQLEASARSYLDVVTLSPNGRHGRQAGLRLATLAEAFARSNNLPLAHDAYAGAIRTPGAGVEVFLNAALVSVRLNRADRAADVLDLATRRFPANPDVWYRLGRVQAQSSQRAEAAVSFRRALALDPTRGDVKAALDQVSTAPARSAK